MKHKLTMKNRKFLEDIIVNTIAFGTYMIAHQLLYLPYMAKVLTVDDNAKLLLYIMIANIVTISFGNEFGVLYQIQMGREETHNTINDVLHLLMRSNLLILLFSPALILLKFTIQETIFLIVITLITNTRLFFQSILRHKKKFLAIFISNIGYLIGTVVGIILFRQGLKNYWMIIFIAEIIGLTLVFIQEKTFLSKLKPVSEDFVQIKKTGLNLVFASFLGNIPNYGDKILVLPLLGSMNMSVYYAGTALSKMLLLLINPINGVLLSWLSSNSIREHKKIVIKILRINIVLIIVILILSFPIIYLTTYFLYNSFLDQVVAIIVPLAISSAFNISTANLKIVFLRYYKIETIKYINMAKIFLFAILTPIGAKLGGLLGFAYTVAFSNALLWFVYYISMRVQSD